MRSLSWAMLATLVAAPAASQAHGHGGRSPARAARPAPLEQRLIRMERDSWEAWQRQDAGFWRHFLSDDHLEFHRTGVSTREEVIAFIASRVCTVTRFSLGHFTFRRFDADTAVLIYRAEQTTSCGGQRVPSPVWATSLYERRHGRWVNALYGHTPTPTPAD
jgi:hypothetical protein